MIDPEERQHLIYLRIEQAEHTIQEAQSSLEIGNYAAAANRIYYGMFYAVLALGLLHQFETSKHMQLIGWFNKNFIHTAIFPTEFTAYVKKAFDARADADYDMEGFDFHCTPSVFVVGLIWCYTHNCSTVLPLLR